MKNLYNTPKYKRWHKNRLEKIERRHSSKIAPNRKKIIGSGSGKGKSKPSLKLPVIAPLDFRLITNTEECLLFFYKLRHEDYINHLKDNKRFISVTLEDIEKIDYAAISVLTAISEDLKDKRIILRGDFPSNPVLKQYIIDSGFLNHMVSNNNKKFALAEKSELIFFEKGCGILSAIDNRRITNLVKKVVLHLTKESDNFLPIKTILLEVCGNSIEWADTSNKQWLLGVKYEDGKVVFTVTDVGKGILQTLHRRFAMKILDAFGNKTECDILKSAFERKYGSSTQETNRNKGLPAVKASADQGIILNLKVLTNNVILHFDNVASSRIIRKGSARFKGTMYQWEMNKDCIDKIKIT